MDVEVEIDETTPELLERARNFVVRPSLRMPYNTVLKFLGSHGVTFRKPSKQDQLSKARSRFGTQTGYRKGPFS